MAPPVVLNWGRSARGSSSFDAAVTYVILRTAESKWAAQSPLISGLRKRFANIFIKEFGAAEVLDRVERRNWLLDSSLSVAEGKLCSL